MDTTYQIIRREKITTQPRKVKEDINPRENALETTLRVYSPKLGKEIEVSAYGKPKSVSDPRRENLGAAPTTWW